MKNRNYKIVDKGTEGMKYGGNYRKQEFLTKQCKVENKCNSDNKWDAGPDAICRNIHTFTVYSSILIEICILAM